MTVLLFRDDPYLSEAEARVIAHTTEGGVVLDRTIFYPEGGGQPGDSGHVSWAGQQIDIGTTLQGAEDGIVLVPAQPAPLPALGTPILQRLDWPRRYGHMRLHTALHLMGAALAAPVIRAGLSGRTAWISVKLAEPLPDHMALEARLNDWVDRDLAVDALFLDGLSGAAQSSSFVTGRIAGGARNARLSVIRIGQGMDLIDLQPCSGTHVARTSEIGRLRLGRGEGLGQGVQRLSLYLD